ncbi:MAG: ABC transporter substrate-binding protein [Rhodospirillales bacterium]|nr:ABC transporter substrate-binding protein [Rhodospirillales bacterium]
MRTILIAIVALTVTTFFSSGASAYSLDEITTKGIIRIAVYRDFPPFSYREKGKLKGVDVDIAKEIAKEIGVKLEFMELTADETVDDDLRNAVWKGHILNGAIADVMLHVPYDRVFAKRNNMVVIFGPYYTEKLAFAWDKAKVGDSQTVAMFGYEKVGVEVDTMSDFYLVSAFNNRFRENVVHFNTSGDATDALKNKEVVAVMAPITQLSGALGSNNKDFPINTPPTPGLAKSQWLVGASVMHTYRALGYAVGDILTKMVKNGRMEQIFESYDLPYFPPPDSLLDGG